MQRLAVDVCVCAKVFRGRTPITRLEPLADDVDELHERAALDDVYRWLDAQL